MENDLSSAVVNISSQSFISFLADTWLAYFFWLIIGLIILLLVRFVIYKLSTRHNYIEHIVYKVRLPKDKPGDKEREVTAQQLHEDIAVAEAFFSTIGGLRAQRGFKAWLFGRQDHFSFEIIAANKLISFYVTAPKHMSRYLEQQVEAYYPEAVLEVVEDYNIFHPYGTIAAGTIKTSRNYIFPIKTYKKVDTDPLNSILNVLTKLDTDDGVAIQYIARSAKKSWHYLGRDVVRRAHRTQSLNEGLRYLGIFGKTEISRWFLDFFHGMKPINKMNDKNSLSQQQNMYKRFTAMEEEMLKGIEEKNSKAGLDVNIRIVVNAANKGRAIACLENIASALQQYNYYQYGNIFNNRVNKRNQQKIIKDFIYRHYSDSRGFILNTEELCSLYHFPLPGAETPNIEWLIAKHASAPTNIPSEGISIGHNIYRGVIKDIKIKRDDRRRHMYVIGKSGVGKSQFIATMAIQDIMNGEGVCILDPHGDLIRDVLERIPPQRAEDVILFAPADIERPLALNLLEYDPRYPEQKTFVINEMIKIFDKLYDLKQTGGPIFEQYMRNAMLLIMSDPESGSTLMEIPKVLADPDFRKLKLDRCNDPTVVDFWKKEAEKAGGDAALANIVPYITSKLTTFISNDMMRPIIGQQKSSFNLRDVMDSQKILLVDLSKGQVGEINAYLLGMILVGKILMSALSRTDMPQDKRKDFYLYIDEFQNFTTDSICSILSEARKYNLNLIIAHQYLGQLTVKQDTSIRDAVFGNVGTWIVFKIGSEDAEVVQKEFNPVFNLYDLINIEKYTAYVKLLIENTASRPFSMSIPWPLPGVKNEDMAVSIKQLSRLKHGQDRSIIEAEIKQRVRQFS